jgi:hypothetical protein
VHHPSCSSSGSFFLLVVFRQSSFHLSEESVGMALHSVLGGSPGGFHITCVQPCHFRFSIASKAVGSLDRAKMFITTANFDVYFRLWRDEGANWQKEFHRGKKIASGLCLPVTSKFASLPQSGSGPRSRSLPLCLTPYPSS